MNEIISRHNFEVAKNGLKRFSQKNNSELELQSVKESGGFLGFGDHKVTGTELNNRLSTIQGHLIDVNKTSIETIKEFGQVYDALEALDKDYIQAILINIKAVEETSNEVKSAQSDIKKLLDNQKKTLETLKKFHKKIEKYNHIFDVDTMWDDFTNFKQALSRAEDTIQKSKNELMKNSKDIKSLNEFEKRINKIKKIDHVDELWSNSNIVHKKTKQVEKQVEELLEGFDTQVFLVNTLISFKENIDSISHLADVDELWESVQEFHEIILSTKLDIKEIQTEFDVQKNLIQELLSYKSLLESYEHLKDIDDIWDQLEDSVKTIDAHELKFTKCYKSIDSNKNEISILRNFKRELEESEHLKDIDTIWKNVEETSKELAEQGRELKSQDDSINFNQQEIKTLNVFKNELGNLVHLSDVDLMWDKQYNLISSFESIETTIDDQQQEISNLKKTIDEVQEDNKIRDQLFTKRLRFAYGIAAGSMGLAILELALILMKVV